MRWTMFILNILAAVVSRRWAVVWVELFGSQALHRVYFGGDEAHHDRGQSEIDDQYGHGGGARMLQQLAEG